MGIFDRLEDVIKSYLNQEDERIFGSPRSRGRDPDLAEAEAELESFLRDGKPGTGGQAGKPGDRGTGAWGEGRSAGGTWSESRNTERNQSGWGRENGKAGSSAGGFADGRAGTAGRRTDRTGKSGPAPGLPPEKLQPDFAELGLPFGAGPEECKAAYKRLLKLHHPDRHAGHEGNMRKATEKSVRINAAYDRITMWREGKREP